MSVTDQPRDGGRFAPKAPRRKTATEILQEADWRACNNKLLIEPPVPIGLLNGYRQVTDKDPTFAHNREMLRHVTDWLEATAKAGVPRDLWRAWVSWEPINGESKRRMHDVLDQLNRQCALREVHLRKLAEAERMAIQARAWRENRLAKAQEAVETARQELEQREAELAEIVADDEAAKALMAA